MDDKNLNYKDVDKDDVVMIQIKITLILKEMMMNIISIMIILVIVTTDEDDKGK